MYTDERQYNNPFHVHELYFDEFRELLEKHFRSVRFRGQRIYCNSSIWPVFSGEDNKVVEYVMDRNPKEFVFVENDKRTPLYFLAIASDAENITETGSALIDVSDALLKQKDRQIEAHAREQERLGTRRSPASADSAVAAAGIIRQRSTDRPSHGRATVAAAGIIRQRSTDRPSHDRASNSRSCRHYQAEINRIVHLIAERDRFIQDATHFKVP